MAYVITDFIALIRNSPAGAELLSMPGLDYVVAAMSRAGLFKLWSGQSAPTANQAVTAWIKPATPSWSAEGALYLYNPNHSAYEPASLLLWSNMLMAAWSGLPNPIFDAIAPTTVRGDLISRGATTNQRLPLGAAGSVLASNGTDAIWQGGSVTVAQLPAVVVAGARAFVTDATVTTFASVVAGGGANKIPVVFDGTHWIIG